MRHSWLPMLMVCMLAWFVQKLKPMHFPEQCIFYSYLHVIKFVSHE